MKVLKLARNLANILESMWYFAQDASGSALPQCKMFLGQYHKDKEKMNSLMIDIAYEYQKKLVKI